MAITSGFFNSKNGDRKYDAEVMSSIFDGIINDGVFQSVGTAFAVKASSGNVVNVGIGRCWFNSTWLLNDAVLPVTFAASDVLNPRWDAVVIEIDRSESVRAGSIKMVKGTASTSPSKPSMVKTAYKNQYPLAYIYRKAGATEITQADITNMIGTSSCPYVNGILEVQNIDKIVAQWQSQWDQWYKNTSTWTNNWNNWFKQTKDWEDKWNQWFANETGSTDADLDNYLLQSKTEIDKWFNDLRNNLDKDTAVALASKIADLQSKFDSLASERALYDAIEDSNGRSLVGSDGTEIIGKVIFDSDGATFVGDSDGSNKAYFANLPASGWTGDAANGYSQIVTCSGMGAGTIVLPPMFKPTGNKDTDLALRTAIGYISIVETLEDKIQVTCWEAKPSIDLDIVLLEGAGATGADDIVIGPNTDTFFPDNMLMTSFGGKVAPVPMSRFENAIEDADTKAENALDKVAKLDDRVKNERARALKGKADKVESATIYPDEGSNLRVTAHGFTLQNGSGDPSPPLMVDEKFEFTTRVIGSANSYAVEYIVDTNGYFTVRGLSSGGSTEFSPAITDSANTTTKSYDGRTLKFAKWNANSDIPTFGTEITLFAGDNYTGADTYELTLYVANKDFTSISKVSVTNTDVLRNAAITPGFNVYHVALYFIATTRTGFKVNSNILIHSFAEVEGNVREIVTGGQQANLFNQKYNTTINGVSFTFDGTGKLIINGTASSSISSIHSNFLSQAIDIPAGEYTFWCKIDKVYTDKDGCAFRIHRTETGVNELLGFARFTTGGGSFSFRHAGGKIAFGMYIGSGSIFDNNTIEVVLNKGKTAAPYTPYTGAEYGTVVKTKGMSEINKLIPLTAPLCEGDTVQTYVKSGCDKKVAIGSEESIAKLSKGSAVGSEYWGLDYGDSEILGYQDGYTAYSDWVERSIAYGGEYTHFYNSKGFIRIVLKAKTSDEALSLLKNKPLSVWYRSTEYTPENDIPVCLETHKNAYKEYLVADMNNSEEYPGWRDTSIPRIIGTGYTSVVAGSVCNIVPNGNVRANTKGEGVLFFTKDQHGGRTQTAFKATCPDLVVQATLPYKSPITYAHDPIYIEAAPNGDGNLTITGEANGQVSVEYNKSIARAFDEILQSINTVEQHALESLTKTNEALSKIDMYHGEASGVVTPVVSETFKITTSSAAPFIVPSSYNVSAHTVASVPLELHSFVLTKGPTDSSSSFFPVLGGMSANVKYFNYMSGQIKFIGLGAFYGPVTSDGYTRHVKAGNELVLEVFESALTKTLHYDNMDYFQYHLYVANDDGTKIKVASSDRNVKNPTIRIIPDFDVEYICVYFEAQQTTGASMSADAAFSITCNVFEQ